MQPFTRLILAPLLTAITALIAQAKLPNIIYLMSDDQSSYSMGCYGNIDVQTPNLDRLSADGITFDNHYVSTAICMASRASVMTGMYEYKTGCNFQHGDLTQDKWLMSYPVLLREAGYLTAFAGKFGFDIIDGPDGKRLPMPEHDFDLWGGGEGQTKYKTMANDSMKKYADEYPHSTLSYGAFGSDFIAQASQTDQPFCLSISFKAPHKPATPDSRFDAIYAGKTFIKPANYGRENGKHFSKQSRQDRQYERFESWGYADRYDEVMAIYHQQIYAIDVAVGMIREALNSHGIADNTVIIYTSDNGFFCGSHGYGSKVLPYQESTKVPLIIYDPRHTNSGKQLRSDALTANIDFTPTFSWN
jgi:arylsulfatase A-like enzyme